MRKVLLIPGRDEWERETEIEKEGERERERENESTEMGWMWKRIDLRPNALKRLVEDWSPRDFHRGNGTGCRLKKFVWIKKFTSTSNKNCERWEYWMIEELLVCWTDRVINEFNWKIFSAWKILSGENLLLLFFIKSLKLMIG